MLGNSGIVNSKARGNSEIHQIPLFKLETGFKVNFSEIIKYSILYLNIFYI